MPTGTFSRLSQAPPRVCRNPDCGKTFAVRQDGQAYCDTKCRKHAVYRELRSGKDALRTMFQENPALLELATKMVNEKRGTTNGERINLHPSGLGLEPGGVHPESDG